MSKTISKSRAEYLFNQNCDIILNCMVSGRMKWSRLQNQITFSQLLELYKNDTYTFEIVAQPANSGRTFK